MSSEPQQIAFGIVVSDFNQTITQKLLQGAEARLQTFDVSREHITIIHVPGAIEIPLIAKLMAKSKKYAAIICLGVVIRGETSHYDYVCKQVSDGCQAVMMEFELPVIFGVLTTDNEQQAEERAGGVYGHKGIEAVDSAMHMVGIVSRLISE